MLTKKYIKCCLSPIFHISSAEINATYPIQLYYIFCESGYVLRMNWFYQYTQLE